MHVCNDPFIAEPVTRHDDFHLPRPVILLVDDAAHASPAVAVGV